MNGTEPSVLDLSSSNDSYSGDSSSSSNASSILTDNSAIEICADGKSIYKWMRFYQSMSCFVRETHIHRHLRDYERYDSAHGPLVRGALFDVNGSRVGIEMRRAAGDLDHFLSCDTFRAHVTDERMGPPQRVLFELLLTLVKLHDVGIVHRDIKPGNILLFMDDFDSNESDTDTQMCCPDEAPKYVQLQLTDFGNSSISHEYDWARTNYTDNVCTVTYAPPEDGVSGAPLTDRFDVYCVGYTMLHYILFNHRISRMDTQQLLEAIANGDGERPVSAAQRGLFVEVLSAMVHPDPRCRPSVRDILSSSLYQVVPTHVRMDAAHRPDVLLCANQVHMPGTVGHLLSVCCAESEASSFTLCVLLAMLDMATKLSPSTMRPHTHNRSHYVTKKQGLWVVSAVLIATHAIEAHVAALSHLTNIVINYIDDERLGSPYKTDTRPYPNKSIYQMCHHIMADQLDYKIPMPTAACKTRYNL